jgi:hypothetical protein
MSLRVLEVAAGWAMGEFDGCLAVVWRSQPTGAAFQKRNEILQELVQQRPKRCCLIEVVEETSKPPADDDRRTAMQVFKQLGGDLAAIAFVLEGNQMKSALNRAILTTMTFFVKQLQPTKIFKHPADAARWAKQLVPDAPAAFETELAAALEELRAKIPKS